ncbi:indolepyruvate ferredoxin oxidoreductase family protein [Amycolatopsis acidiphila]|uniref:Indolepyruvate ferredoxin oxidoreductase family protein n=1 Tax=Amycolatopsis acidiphila TaxID=715473 RepID=A0A557ZYV3_9PSEU|nr:indolepyruvate ferredoxin oxidoreductase family protein [Amycolatopsis acidiphila]TVT17177.1 indolepyruvate ferredoxin oxidoreductase family protein [Amycolatopsis acidiphila]UIJ63062.1 indolepyruvate ferredoxin oxidoreductase family protein [Amycolatopsis acidiphila]GHG65917.1 indolepyruvate ferredoxin oxidoreductase [Amycolatopsis acidiphila]
MATPSGAPFSLREKYVRDEGTIYLTGVQALVRTLLERSACDRGAGLTTATFVSGYEGSPLAGYDLELARQRDLLTAAGVRHEPGLNEELAATAVLGSQLAGEVGSLSCDGVTGIWYGKAPGLDRASDALRHANLVGTGPAGGAVALVGDDPGAKSSTVPGASEAALADLAIPTLYPADSQEVVEFGLHAQYLSRFSGVWTALKMATAVADGASTAVVRRAALPAVFAELGPSAHRPSSQLLGPNLMALERSLHEIRLPRALDYARHSGLNTIVHSRPSDRVGVIAAGKTYLDLRQALELLGLDEAALARHGIRLLKLGMVHPVEPGIVTEFAAGLDEIVVVEEKRSFLETAVKEILYGRTGAPSVVGKRDAKGSRLFAETGELDADSVAVGLASALEHLGLEPVRAWQRERARARTAQISLPLVTRTPYFCSGCPHNSSTAVRDGSLVGAGIGCHAMVLFMEPDRVGTVVGLTQMGGEGAQWIGMAPFLDEQHFVQNIGDGTFLHSGSLAVRAAVAAGVNVTYKLLYNSTVAMTGGQDAVGALPVERLAGLLLAEGVERVVITTEDPGRLAGRSLPAGVRVRPREDLPDVQRELAAVPGVTVLIHDQECAAEKRRKRRRGKLAAPAARVMINERICEGCGDCGSKSNCLSVQPVATEFGRKTRINQSSCNLDFSCLEGDCPSFVTVLPGGTQRRARVADLPADALPAPTGVPGTDFALRICGVGGTGVVTISQVLATAAVLEGRSVRTLDQTGLAQKGGAVISDLKVSAAPAPRTAKLHRGSCDLYLGCDVVVAADPANLAVASADRTVAVVSSTQVPTGRMVVDTTARFPPHARISAAIDEASRRSAYLDAGRLADRLFGDEQYANMILVGAALQTGALPLDATALEQAITLNGTAVEANIQALRRGRQAIADPDAVRGLLEDGGVRTEPVDPAAAAPLAAAAGLPGGSAVAELVRARVSDLIGYQNTRYAKEYAEFVARVHAAEDAAAPGSAVLTEAVARYLHKLMAYKDEYEVARLSLAPAFQAELAATFGPSARYANRLHPPVLRVLGMRRKIALGPSARPALRVLKGLRRLRGTPADLFGYARVRKVERALIAEYREAVLESLDLLSPVTLPVAVRLAELPDLVRGYERIKLDNVDRYRAALAQAREQLREVPVDSAV